MLKQRVITAVLILPVALAAIILTPVPWFDALLVVLLGGLMNEWMRLVPVARAWRFAFVAFTPLVFVAALADWSHADQLRASLLLVAVVLWLLSPFWLVARHPLTVLVKTLAGVFIVAGAGVALHELKTMTPNGALVLLVFLLVWAADIGAYFAGTLLGRRRLAPAISPGKTWEGLIGGLLLTLFVGASAGYLLAGMRPGVAWVALLAGVAIISVIGDLVESLLKRQADVKDSGKLLPGHGGLLDRLDSVLAAAPLFLFMAEHSGLLADMHRFGQ